MSGSGRSASLFRSGFTSAPSSWRRRWRSVTVVERGNEEEKCNEGQQNYPLSYMTSLFSPPSPTSQTILHSSGPCLHVNDSLSSSLSCLTIYNSSFSASVPSSHRIYCKDEMILLSPSSPAEHLDQFTTKKLNDSLIPLQPHNLQKLPCGPSCNTCFTVKCKCLPYPLSLQPSNWTFKVAYLSESESGVGALTGFRFPGDLAGEALPPRPRPFPLGGGGGMSL